MQRRDFLRFGSLTLAQAAAAKLLPAQMSSQMPQHAAASSPEGKADYTLRIAPVTVELAPERILPNHGDPRAIAAGGYTSDLIISSEQYMRTLQRCATEPSLREMTLQGLITESLQSRSIHYFAPYEAVHRHNVKTVLAAT